MLFSLQEYPARVSVELTLNYMHLRLAVKNGQAFKFRQNQQNQHNGEIMGLKMDNQSPIVCILNYFILTLFGQTVPISGEINVCGRPTVLMTPL